jgi:hypothetical protein
MSFFDSLSELNGSLTNTVSDLGGKYLDIKLQKERNKGSNAVQVAETIQPALNQPVPTQTIKGVDSNGETMPVRVGDNAKGLFDDDIVVYAGMGLLTVVGLALAYKLVK